MSVNQDTPVSKDESPWSPNQCIRDYLCSRSEVYRELVRVQAEGWSKESGDQHFQNQRRTADNTTTDIRASRSFFDLMQRIGNEMQATTGVMSLGDTANILDLCMAPGGYSASALKFSPGASVSGATLPEEQGGHRLFVRDGFRGAAVRVWEGDLTSLVGDMGIDDDDGDGAIPDRYAGFGEFRKDEVWPGERFDLVFCDGQVLRNHCHHMVESRQRCEARRLTCSQLLIALRHVKVGGSMVVLLHKIDRWDTVSLIRAFDRFARITLFKPLAAHKARSSFYLVARNIQPDHEDARTGIRDWTHAWKDATFRNLTGEEDVFSGYSSSEDVVLKNQVTEAMDEFGERLITLGENAWKIQKEAIEKSAWFKGSKD